MAGSFEDFGLVPELVEAVTAGEGWALPTPVQAEAIPLILGGGDVMAAAETGSGKTGAFALPALQVCHELLQARARGRAEVAAKAGGGAKAGAAGPKAAGAELSTEDRDALLAVSPDGLACQSRAERAWAGGRARVGVLQGRFYFEVTCRDDGLSRVGWATRAAKLELGTCKQGFGYGGTAKKSHNRSFESYGETYGNGDVIGCFIDCKAGAIRYYKNGVDLGEAFAVPAHLRGQAFYPAVCLKNAEVELNFGAKDFSFFPKGAGCKGVARATAQEVRGGEDAADDAGSAERGPLCLILEPTRDLAEQTHKCVVSFSKHLASPSVRSVLLVGGVNPKPMVQALKAGAHVVTGTLQRVNDFIRGGQLQTKSIKFLVLDEADRLLDSGNRDDILKIFQALPKGAAGAERLQVLLFSATLHSPEIRTLARQLCQNPILVDLKGKDSVPDTVHHTLVRIDPAEDRSWLQKTPAIETDGCHTFDEKPGPNTASREAMSEAVKILKPRILQRVIDSFGMDQCLIFCRTNFDCDHLEGFLNSLGGGSGRAFRGKAESGKENPYSCVVLAGARSTEDRRRALAAFKEGDVRFLICTDVAARGIDIKELPFVINMTLPDKDQIEDYIHRIGRVGRADTMGLAISLVSTVPEKVWFCSKKGYKPWFNPKKQDLKLNQDGGHTKWYNEPQLLGLIEKRLKRKIDPLNDDFSLPASLKRDGPTVYGQQKGAGPADQKALERVEALKPTVQVLSDLEVQAQHSYLMLKTRWTG